MFTPGRSGHAESESEKSPRLPRPEGQGDRIALNPRTPISFVHTIRALTKGAAQTWSGILGVLRFSFFFFRFPLGFESLMFLRDVLTTVPQLRSKFDTR